MSQYRRREDVVNLRLRLVRCIDVAITTSLICYEVNLLSNIRAFIVHTTFMVHRELKLLSSVEATLEQRYNFDVVASTLLQSFVLVV